MNTVPEAGRIVAYLGGRGSFSEEACQRFLPGCELMPLSDFEAVAMAVCQGSADMAVLPVYNNLVGPIDAVLVLLAHPELRTMREEELQIRLHLLGRSGTQIGAIRQVASHRAALDQCAAFVARHGLTTVATPSTAEAARQVAEAVNPTCTAIASEAAAALYGLSILMRDIQDEAGSITKFSIVERRDQFA